MNKEPESQLKEASSSSVRTVFPVTGMTCAGCAISVESMLKATPGVIDAGVNFANNTAWAEYNSLKTNPAALQKSIQSIGYDIIIDTENSVEIQEEFTA
jgi:Cu2+-exporting ATPase